MTHSRRATTRLNNHSPPPVAPAPMLSNSGISSSVASPPRGAGRSICGAPEAEGLDAAWTDGGSVGAAARAVTPATDGGAEEVEAAALVVLGLHNVTGTVCASPTDAITSSESTIACKPGVAVLVGVGDDVAVGVDASVAAAVADGVDVAAVGEGVPAVGDAVAAVGEGVPAVGGGVPAVGDGVPAVGDGVPAVGDAVPEIGDGVTGVGVGVSDVGVPVVGEGVPAVGDGVPTVGDGVPVGVDGVAVYMVAVSVAIAAAV